MSAVVPKAAIPGGSETFAPVLERVREVRIQY